MAANRRERESKALEILCQALQPDIDDQLCQVMLFLKRRLDAAAAKSNRLHGTNYGPDVVERNLMYCYDHSKRAVRDNAQTAPMEKNGPEPPKVGPRRGPRGRGRPPGTGRGPGRPKGSKTVNRRKRKDHESLVVDGDGGDGGDGGNAAMATAAAAAAAPASASAAAPA
eukprot:UC1_evm1s863